MGVLMKSKVKYKHFYPNRSEQQTFSGLLNLIDEMAPSDSSVQAIVDRVSDGTFKVNIVIRAFVGSFISEEAGFSPLTSFMKAQKSILSRLDEWKKDRFSPPSQAVLT